MFKQIQVQVFPQYHTPEDLTMAVNQFLASKGVTYVDLKFSTNEVIAVNDGKGEKVIAYHAVLIYKV